jgi:hypothetical protein
MTAMIRAFATAVVQAFAKRERGLSSGEALARKWPRVDLLRGQLALEVGDRKNGSPATVP